MSEPRKYRKKPVVIEAMQLTQSNAIEVSEWSGGEAKFMSPAMPSVFIRTLEGSMRADVGDFVIRGVQGEFYPCKPDIFEATYEAVDSDAPMMFNSEGWASYYSLLSREERDTLLMRYGSDIAEMRRILARPLPKVGDPHE